MSRARSVLHALLWCLLSFILFGGGSLSIRPRLISWSFDGPWMLTTSAPRALLRTIPVEYERELASIRGVKSVVRVGTAPAGDRVRTYEIMALGAEGLGVVDATGRLKTRSLAPDWVTLDAESVLRWQSDLTGLIPSENLVKAYGWKVGDSIQLPVAVCGIPLSGTVRGVALGMVGDRVLAHYEHLNEARRDCPTHDQVAWFESEVEIQDQERVATEIDRRFRDRPAPTLSYRGSEFYWKVIVGAAQRLTSIYSQIFLGIALIVLVALLLLARRGGHSARLLWTSQAIAALAMTTAFLLYRRAGVHLYDVWGLENVALLKQAYGATLVLMTVLTGGWRSVIAVMDRVAVATERAPAGWYAFAIGAAAGVSIGSYFGIADGAKRAIDVAAMRDVQVVYPWSVADPETLSQIRDEVRASVASGRDDPCISLQLVTQLPSYSRDQAGRLVETRVHACTPVSADCRFVEPTQLPHRALGDVGAKTGLDEFPVAGGIWPIKRLDLDVAASVTNAALLTDLDELLASPKLGGVGDPDALPFVLTRKIPPSLVRYPAMPWLDFVGLDCWGPLDSARGATMVVLLWALAGLLLFWRRLDRTVPTLVMLVLGASTGAAAVAMAGALGAGGTLTTDLYSVHYALMLGTSTMRAMLVFCAGLAAVGWMSVTKRRQ